MYDQPSRHPSIFLYLKTQIKAFLIHAHLSTGFAPAQLSSLDKASVPICSDDTVV